MMKIIKQTKTLFIKLYFWLLQSCYHDGDNRIKYIFKRRNSKHLIIVFTGFAGYEQKGRYNYYRTLKDYNCNQLFILDDTGYHGVGSYYFGDNFSIFNSGSIYNLINKIKQKCHAKNVICLGSSKGGTAALGYGLRINANAIVAGSPQYRIANYLKQNSYHQKILSAITNDEPEREETLNRFVEQGIKESDNGDVKVYLLYSSAEPSYNDDVSFLIEELKKNGKNCAS